VDSFFGVSHWRGDHVSAAGPFAQINRSAAVAAEGEVSVRALYDFLADGAAEGHFALAGHDKFYCRLQISDCRLKSACRDLLLIVDC
jgi:hypothetical protein